MNSEKGACKRWHTDGCWGPDGCAKKKLDAAQKPQVKRQDAEHNAVKPEFTREDALRVLAQLALTGTPQDAVRVRAAQAYERATRYDQDKALTLEDKTALIDKLIGDTNVDEPTAQIHTIHSG